MGRVVRTCEYAWVCSLVIEGMAEVQKQACVFATDWMAR